MTQANIPIGETADPYIYIYISVVIFLLISAIAIYVNVISPFIEERKYLKMELRRSKYDSEEYRYYKKKLNRLYLSYIPFIGRFFK